MATSIADKLRIRANTRILVIDAPPDFRKMLKHLPPGVSIGENETEPDQVHWFVKNKSDLEKGFGRASNRLRRGDLLWVYFPKKSSGMQTDLGRDVGWEILNERDKEFQRIILISFDDTWSVFGFRLR